MENAIQQWSEHPLRTTIALGTWALPGIGKIAKVRRMNKYAGITASEVYDAGKIASVDDWYKMAPEYQDKLRSQMYHDTKYADLLNLEKNMPERMGMKDRLQLSFYRNFAHQYSKLSDPSSSAVHNLTLKEALDKKIQDEVIAPYVMTAPDETYGPMIARYWLGDASLTDLPLEVRAWAKGMSHVIETKQAEMLADGFLSLAEYKKVGKRYVPLLEKGKDLSIGGPTQTLLTLKGGRPYISDIGRMESTALFERTRGLDEFVEMIKAEKVITDPKVLTVRGLMESTLLHENYKHVRDVAIDARYGLDSAGFAKVVDKKGLNRAYDEWIPIFGDSKRPGIPGGERVRRMVAKAKGVDPEDLGPHYMSRQSFDSIFGPDGLIGQAREAAAWGSGMVRQYKTAKTAFNLYTQGQNIMGNIAFLSMRGMRFMTGADAGENWKLLQGAITNMNEYLAKQRIAQKTGKAVSMKLKPMKVGDRTFSQEEILGELSNPWVKEIIEESAFLKAEGSNTNIMAKAAERADSIHDFLGRTTRKFDNFLSGWKRFYNVGDSAPKLAYYMKLRANGFTSSSAAQEVARALPIYRGIAEGPRVPVLGRIGPGSLRKFMFPWISFPAETMRIMKNNLMDNPMRVLPWLKSVNIMQAMMYGAGQVGLGTPFTFEDHLGLRRQLPIHAQRPTAVTTPFTDRNDDLRSMMMDWLPWSTVLPGTLAEEAPTISKIPVVSPEDIAPIITGMLGIFTGRGPFGQELRTTGLADKFGKTIANFVGFISPPYIQKYMFDITSPREQSITGLNTYKFEQDLGRVINPQTMKPGSWLADHLLNNSILKNYASSGEQELFNKSLKVNREVEQVRGELTRRWNASVRSGQEQEASTYLMQIMETFVKEYGSGPISQQKFMEFVVRHRKSIMKHPQLRRYSEEDLLRMAVENNTRAKDQRSIAQKTRLDAIRRELIVRNMTR
jgi:hypothetical protein